MVTGNIIAQSTHTQNIQQLSQSNSMITKTGHQSAATSNMNQALIGQQMQINSSKMHLNANGQQISSMQGDVLRRIPGQHPNTAEISASAPTGQIQNLDVAHEFQKNA